MNLTAISKLATKFRLAIEVIPPAILPTGLQCFPKGACGDTSLLLGAYLIDNGVIGFKYVSGERGSREGRTWATHAWLQRESCIIDITADQFPDGPASIIVADPSLWHGLFTANPPQASDFRQWSGYGAEILHPAYSQIVKKIAELNASIRSDS